MELSDKEKLLEKLLAQKGFNVMKSQQSKPDRTKQLEKFLRIVNASGSSLDIKEKVDHVGSTIERTLTNVNNFQEAYQDTSKVVFVGNVMSPEILFAMNLVPFNVEVLSTFFATNGTANRFLDLGEKNHIARDTCSVVRCVMGAALDNCLPSPDFLAFASYPCDTTTRMFYALSEHYQKPYYLLDIPYHYNDKNVWHLAQRLREMQEQIEQTFGIKADEDKLHSTIQYSKQSLGYYEKLMTLCQTHQLSISVVKLTTDVMSYVGQVGSPEIVESIRLNYEEMLEKVNMLALETDEELADRPKVIWKGPVPYYDNEMISYFEEECGINIIPEMLVAEVELSDLINTDDTYLFLAKKLLLLSEWDSMTDSLNEQTWDIYDKYGIDGVVLFNQWGCRHRLSCGQIQRDQFKQKNLSVLEIDGDFVDSRNYAFSQVKVRIDAFAEMLKEKKL